MRIDLHCLKCEGDGFKLIIDPEGWLSECQTCNHQVRIEPLMVVADEFGMLFLYNGEESEESDKLLKHFDGR